ncbi:hypothetical protein [Streptacidiphilus jiangxiensis]|uniref:Secreted protein n=1 Tax=Streptacidiphilus jiangxiensis TaxID=235985 RepID=A0A1H7P986_STRJI|nr:hypothetical protein [Streptacidiphilus jiangxiensis]SEL32331.1 hypothetical protein SAMN05414137_107276 [Streptacidiphilus jiangxiensis]
MSRPRQLLRRLPRLGAALGCALALVAAQPGTTGAAADASGTRATPAPLHAQLLLPDGPIHTTTVLSYSEAVTARSGTLSPLPGNLTIVRYAGDADSGFLRRTMFFPATPMLTHGLALTLTRAGSNQPEMKITLGRPTVISDDVSGANGGVPKETITFSYGFYGSEVFVPDGHGGSTDIKSCLGPDGTFDCPQPVN